MPTRSKEQALMPAQRAPFQARNGITGKVAKTSNAPGIPWNWAADNGFEYRFRNAANTDDIRVLSVGTDDTLYHFEEAFRPMRKTIQFNISTAASLTTQHFFIAPTACRIVGIQEIHATAESTAATMTGYVEKLTGTTAPGSGTTVMSGTFNLKGTANTLQTATLGSSDTGDSDDSLLQLAAGDRLGFKFSTAGTELAGLVVEITLAPGGDNHTIVWNLNANGDLIDSTAVFLANRDFIVTGVQYCHSTKGTNGSAVNLQLVKDTSTNAPGAGTDLLTDNTNAGFDCKGANNTVQVGTLSATAANLRLAPGDRLSLDFGGTLTSLAGVVVVITLAAAERRKEVVFALAKNGNLVDQAFFIADRQYEIMAASAVWATAAATGNVQLTRDTGTNAPGAGTDLLSMDTNAGWQVDGTANTPEVATWKDTRYNFLMPGDRLSLDFAVGANLAGLVVCVTLRPA